MTEEPRSERLTPRDLGLVPADGFEPFEGVLPTLLCGHNLLQLIRDDWTFLDVECEVAMCVLCGAAMVRWSASPEDRSS